MVLHLERIDDGGSVVTAAVGDQGICPNRGKRFQRLHRWRNRHLQDLPSGGGDKEDHDDRSCRIFQD